MHPIEEFNHCLLRDAHIVKRLQSFVFEELEQFTKCIDAGLFWWIQSDVNAFFVQERFIERCEMGFAGLDERSIHWDGRSFHSCVCAGKETYLPLIRC